MSQGKWGGEKQQQPFKAFGGCGRAKEMNRMKEEMFLDRDFLLVFAAGPVETQLHAGL